MWDTLLAFLAAPTVWLAVAWLCREPISTWLLGRIDFKREQQLTNLKAAIEQQRQENQFLLDHLGNRAARETELALDKKIEAATHVWEATDELKRYSHLAKIFGNLKIEVVNKNISKNENLQMFIDAFSSDLDLSKPIPQKSASLQRLFLTPMAWACFSAYQAVIVHALVYWLSWKQHQSMQLSLKNDELKAMVQTALPEYYEFLDQVGYEGAFLLIDELEEKILFELQSSTLGPPSSDTSAEKAKEVIKLARTSSSSSNQGLSVDIPEFVKKKNSGK